EKLINATDDDGGGAAVGGGAGSEEALEEMGTVPFRATVGNGARGLQRRGHGLGIFPSRPRAFAGLSMGRGRHRRNQRPSPDDLLCGGALEWARRDFEGATVRIDGQRRESRGG